MSEETKSKSRSCIVYTDFLIAAELMSDAQNGRLFKAILSFANGETADLSDDPVLNMAWLPILERLKNDAQKYRDVCEANKRNGRRGLDVRYGKKAIASDRQKKLATASDRTRPPEKTSGRQYNDIDIDIDTDIDIEGENATPTAAAAGVSAANKSFKRWTEQDLIDSVDACIREHPDLAPHKAAFVSYWGEPQANGKPRLCAEKSWETSRRLATWERIDAERKPAPRAGRPPVGQSSDIDDLIDQAKKQRA
ncbi:MAG: DUF6291 domain-containing protein [Lentisphaeria bacterium]|jgi:hypothetical protein